MTDHGVTSVDDLDLVAGKTALVWALLGATGRFGVKGSARAPAAAAPRTRPRPGGNADELAPARCRRSALAALLAPDAARAPGAGGRGARELPRPRAPGRLGHADRGRRRRSLVGPLAALEELADSDTLAPEVGVALVFVLGVAVLGLVDDLLGGRAAGRGGGRPQAPARAARALRGGRARATSAPGC